MAEIEDPIVVILKHMKDTIDRLEGLTEKHKDTLEAFPNKSEQIENCIRLLRARENQINDINVGEKELQRRLQQLKQYIDNIEKELAAWKNILPLCIANKIAVATAAGQFETHYFNMKNPKSLLILNDCSNFERAIDNFNMNAKAGAQATRTDRNQSWCTNEKMKRMFRTFETCVMCDRNSTDYDFLIISEAQELNDANNILETCLYIRGKKQKGFRLPDMTQVTLNVTSTDKSISVKWKVQAQMEFKEFVIQHREKKNSDDGAFTSSLSLLASKKACTIKDLSINTQYEIRLLCQMKCGLYVPSNPTSAHTLLTSKYPLARIARAIAIVGLGGFLFFKSCKT